MANIFTRAALGKIMSDEGLTPEQRTEQVFSLYGRALDDGYIAKSAAQQAQQTARGSDEFKGVKPKFFETVYGMVDRGDGAKPVNEQLDGIRKNFEEYFVAEQQGPKPTFGAPVEGSMPTGQQGAVKGFAEAWGFGTRGNR